jgi:hypothetical protein
MTNIIIFSNFKDTQRYLPFRNFLESKEILYFEVESKKNIFFLLKLMKKVKFVFFINPLPNDYLLFYFLSKIFRKKIFFDFYYSPSLDNETLNIFSVIRLRLKKIIERQLLLNSYKVIFLTPAERNLYLNYHSLKLNSKRHLIYPVIKSNFNVVPDFPYFKNKTEYLTLAWWGNHSYIHNLRLLFDAVDIINNNIKTRILIFVPNQNAKGKILELIDKNHSTENYEFYIGFDFNNLNTHKLISERADLTISHFGTTPQGLNTITNKMIESLSLSIPCLSIKSNAYADFEIIENETFIKAEPSTESIIEALLEYSEKTLQDINLISLKSKKVYNDYFSGDSAQNYLNKIFEINYSNK